MNKDLKETIIDEKTGIEYHLEGDYYIPNLVLPKQEKVTLNKQETSQKRLNQIIYQLKEKSDLTEDLKDTDILYWVGTMNAIKNQAEEIVISELIYV